MGAQPYFDKSIGLYPDYTQRALNKGECQLYVATTGLLDLGALPKLTQSTNTPHAEATTDKRANKSTQAHTHERKRNKSL